MPKIFEFFGLDWGRTPKEEEDVDDKEAETEEVETEKVSTHEEEDNLSIEAWHSALEEFEIGFGSDLYNQGDEIDYIDQIHEDQSTKETELVPDSSEEEETKLVIKSTTEDSEYDMLMTMNDRVNQMITIRSFNDATK